MGIPATVKLLKQSRWSESLRLRDCKLIVDVTEAMYWFIKKPLFEEYPYRMDRFGFSMVAYGQFMRRFFERLRQAQVTPIVVYSGARLSHKAGDLASKERYLEKSSRIRQYKLNRYGDNLDDCIVPNLATNVIKQIIGELKLEAHQAAYEVYPLLAELANRHDCPVLTSHSDFILTNVRRGFILGEQFPHATEASRVPSEISVSELHLNRKMLTSYGLEKCGPALVALYTLLRQDFSGKYHKALNELFSYLPNNLKFIKDETLFRHGVRPTPQPFIRRLEYILAHWPKQLTTVEAIRKQLASTSYSSTELLREFDAIHASFSEPYDFAREITNMAPQLTSPQATSLQLALTQRESTALFCLDILMRQKLFNRGCLEDMETFRSTYSLADPTRKCIMTRNQIYTLSLLDRQQDRLEWRNIAVANRDTNEASELSRKRLVALFSFRSQIEDAEGMDRLIGCIRLGRALNGQYCHELLVMLLIARYSLDNIASRSYDEQPRVSSQLTSAASSDSGPLANLDMQKVKYRLFQEYFLVAIYNCFMYYAFKHPEHSMLNLEALNQDPSLVDDAHDNSLLPKIRVACQEIESNRILNPDKLRPHYIQIKHMIEAFNVGLQSYYELNALHEYPAVRLHLDRYYDGVLIFRLMDYLIKKNGQTSLLQLTCETEVMELVSPQ